ncbi:MAG: phosphoglycerate kinase [bacterium]|nr:phosphoglycerate kinase [bacterium]
MRTIKEFNLKGKRVLVRSDFNVPLSDKGEILDDFRIKESIRTIEYLIKKEAKVILMSHLDRPKNKDPRYSLRYLAKRLEKLLNEKVKFLDDCLGEKVEREIEKMKPGEILLLENLRFHKEEEKGDLNFAKKLAKLGDVYINDAFGASHRSHASIVGVPKYLPSGAGLLLEKEINVLSQVLERPWRPLVAIIGGIKIDTKIKLIEQFLKKADHLLLGSKPAESLLIVKGILIGRPFFEEKEVLEKIEKINLANPKLHLPVDGQMALSTLQEQYFRIGAIGTLRKEEEVFDIGPETRKVFVGIIKSAKMIIWNGPLGMFEKEPFDKGTKEIAEAIVRNHTAFKIAGGGDTVSLISKLDLLDKFDHISTGGGAMLEFLAGEKLPGLEALNYGYKKS